MSEATIDDLSEAERKEYLRSKRDRSEECSDGMCGGCPRCGYVENYDE